MASSESFFAEMGTFSDFDGLWEEGNFHPAPPDWWVVITDVEGSTEAITSGRYKDVNILGAATIAALQNVMGEQAFPFVFGGDGATALIPSEKKDLVEEELCALRALAEKNFGLGLRVGMVSVKELIEEGWPVKVGKYLLPGKYPLAAFRGGAVTRAEEKIRADSSRYNVVERPHGETDLSKLSCRWQPLTAEKGIIMALLVEARTDDKDRSYTFFMNKLSEILKGRIEEANPVKNSAMRYRPLGEMLSADIRYQTSKLRLVPRIFETIAASVLFGGGLFRLFGTLRNYFQSTPSHSDYRKFDDMLRMVLDVTPSQAQEIKSLCRSMYADNTIYFGIHCSDQALMTCYVPSMQDRAHLHFVDGGDGGYAMAARQLKSQIKDA